MDTDQRRIFRTGGHETLRGGGAAATDYAFPVRALRRWAQENLRVEARADGGREAVFQFEGSTCGNVSFNLDYRVVLGAAESGWRIEALQCAPAAYDEGHTRMCCWQADPAVAAGYFVGPAEWLGQPLAAVLGWRPEKSPAGCLCSEASRNHKWQAVLETVHHALFSHENRTRP